MTLYIFSTIFLPLLFICFEFIITINNIKLSTNIIVLAEIISKTTTKVKNINIYKLIGTYN
jgi:hypothetical protein